MDGRIKLSKTGVFLLALTALFLLSVGTVYLLTPRTTQGDYTVEAQAPSEKPKTISNSTAREPCPSSFRMIGTM